MAEISREDLRQHCIRTIENCKKWCNYKGTNPSDVKEYQEHKMVLEMIEKAEKLEKIEKYMDLNNLPDMRENSKICHNKEKLSDKRNCCNTCVDSEICAYREIEQILKGK